MTSEDSDQPAHPHLISFRSPSADALDPWLPTGCSAKTDQTAQMCRLTQVFAGGTFSLLGNAVPRLTDIAEYTDV